MEIDIKEIINLDTKELWNLTLQSQEESEDDYSEIIDNIREGFFIKFPIQYLTEKWYEEYPTSKKAKIMGYGKYPLTLFIKEREKREALMRMIIIENITDTSMTKPRT